MAPFSTALAPGLLLAMPRMADPNFAGAVVLMVEHTEEESFGLIVNQPTELGVPNLMSSLGMPWGGRPDAVVWRGGPVMPASGWVLHGTLGEEASAHSESDNTHELVDGVHLSSSKNNLRVLAAHPPQNVRFLLGYAGWGPNQLAQEVAQGAWLFADLKPELVFETPPAEMWARALRSQGIEPESVVHGRGIN